ncbi:MAG: caspase family protein [Deltaproteobacteria bacterium]|nr:caspase family protein [Deltaproteobacteria bacterium]
MRRVIRSIMQFFLFLYIFSPCLYFTSAKEVPKETGVSPDIGQRWAFCVGICDYDDPEIIDLTKTRNDAKGLARAIKEHGGFDHVIVFTDDLDRDNPKFPSKKGIKSTLNRCAKDIRPQDLILFSFFGHGITDSRGRAFLLTADTRLDRIANTGLPLNYVMGFIKKTGVNKSVIFIDAAREEVKKRGGGPSSGVFPDRYMRGDATALFYSTRKGLHSYDQEDSDHGVFAEYLIRGLEGEADTGYVGNDDGAVTLREIADYVREGISSWSLESAQSQRPYIRISGEILGEMAISSVEKFEIQGEAKGVAAPKSEEVEEIVKVEAVAERVMVEELLERKEVEEIQEEGIEEVLEREVIEEAKVEADIEIR